MPVFLVVKSLSSKPDNNESGISLLVRIERTTWAGGLALLIDIF